jgi:para-nitrobenzyl esterase
MFLDEDASARQTRTVLGALGISPGPGALEKLRAVPADQFVPLHRRLGLGALPPALDGTWLPEAPLRAFAGGRAAGVPLIIGTNTDESRSLRQIIGLPADPRPFDERVQHSGASGDPARLNDLYTGGSDDERWDALTADRDWHAPVQELASVRADAGAATYVYRFDWPTDAVDGALGSAHMAEIPFALDNLESAARTGMFAATIADEARAVEQSRLMSSAWGALAHSGDPRDAVPQWAPFDVERHGTLVLAAGSAELVPHLDGARIDHWRRLTGRPT